MVRSIVGLRKEHYGQWWVRNVARLAVYLFCVSTATSLFGTILSGSGIDAWLQATLDLFLYGGMMFLPGMAVWLIPLGLLPPEWSRRRRRLIAVVTGAVIGVPVQIFFANLGLWWAAVIWGALFPMGSGFVVVLRRRVLPFSA